MRFLYIRSILLLAISIFGAGCAHDVAYRPITKGTSSVEFRKYETPDKSITGNYIIGYVEFDDQGWFHDASQPTALFQAVQNYRGDAPDTQFLIVVYAHGWKHNSSGPDNDIDEFRKLLERLDALEQRLAHDSKKKGRKVVGVYLGWRGASIQIPFIENVTFWTRKNTGERVGDRSAKQLLIELNEFRTSLNSWKDNDRLAKRNQTQLILIGHSFGGMLMYHALQTQLIEHALRLKQVKRDDGKLVYCYGLAKSFGDFILLVNPAFEGAAYEPLFRAATTRPYYLDRQRPVMAIVTSKSDWATKYAFHAGRLYTYAQSAPQPQYDERDTVLDTVGHLPRYITHELKYEPLEAGPADEKREGLSPTTKGQAKESMDVPSRALKDVEETGDTKYAGVKVIKVTNLVKNFPYLVMSANSEIIDGHNDIWNDRFVEFMVSFIAKEIMKVDQKPAEKKDEQNACVPWLDSTAR
jgi:pimeloyl-ACP methyl ester carboxylesterase